MKRLHIQFSKTNILFTLSEQVASPQIVGYKLIPATEKILTQVSAGSSGLRNSRKKQPLAASTLVNNFLENNPNVGALEICTRGFNKNRDRVLTALAASKSIQILRVIDKTPLAHNGCRRPAKRRL